MGNGTKMDAKTARVMIWEELRKVAKPDSRFSWNFAEFITDYEGSEYCAKNLCQTEIYQKANVIFITPDNNLERFREQAIRDQKIILMTNYSISRGVFLLRPEWIPAGKEELASTLDGVQRFWKHMTLKEIRATFDRIDMTANQLRMISHQSDPKYRLPRLRQVQMFRLTADLNIQGDGSVVS